MYLTQCGRVGDEATPADQVLSLLDDTVALSESLRPHPNRHEALKAGLSQLYKQSLQRHGAVRPNTNTLLAIAVELNAQGIAVWLDRARRN